MRLDERECWERLAGARHGVLGTVHARRGVDAVPVVYALVAGTLVIPVDTVKAKTTSRLQRVRNVEEDPRCVLLVEGYDDDWSQLWWVRVHASAAFAPPSPEALDALAARYPQYRDPASVVTTIVLTPTTITGWRA